MFSVLLSVSVIKDNNYSSCYYYDLRLLYVCGCERVTLHGLTISVAIEIELTTGVVSGRAWAISPSNMDTFEGLIVPSWTMFFSKRNQHIAFTIYHGIR